MVIWEIAPIYIYQTGTLITPQSQVDVNLNGDSAPDRVFINSSGNSSIGSGTQPLTNSAGDTVAYMVTNPAAKYVSAPQGTQPTGGRNLMNLNPIDDLDLTFVKRFNITERWGAEFSLSAFNIFNHPQYAGGFLDDALFTSYGPQYGRGSAGSRKL